IFIPLVERDAYYALLKTFEDVGVQNQAAELILKPRRAPILTVAVRVNAIREEDGSLSALRWLMRDISESRKQQQLLADHVRRLGVSNAELEQWASATAHDLREPVRVMAIYSQLLKESLQKKLTNEEAMHLNFIFNAAQKALSLIEDLLAFASVT